MANSSPPTGTNIGTEVVQELYAVSELQTAKPQPIYLLHRDTISTFIHEKMALFGLDARILGVGGIELSLVAALCTAEFQDRWILKAALIQALFITFAVVLAAFLLRDVNRWLQCRKELNVDSLTTDLGSRGSAIEPKIVPASHDSSEG